MGIQDRDYMKRRPDDSSSGHSSPEGKLNEIAANLLGKHRRWVMGVVIVIVALILAGLIAGMV